MAEPTLRAHSPKTGRVLHRHSGSTAQRWAEFQRGRRETAVCRTPADIGPGWRTQGLHPRAGMKAGYEVGQCLLEEQVKWQNHRAQFGAERACAMGPKDHQHLRRLIGPQHAQSESDEERGLESSTAPKESGGGWPTTHHTADRHTARQRTEVRFRRKSVTVGPHDDKLGKQLFATYICR